jgi:hypothetical protein
MANPFTKVANKIVYSLQEMFNRSFDADFEQNTVETLGFDGQSLQKDNADNLATQIQTSGSDTYIGVAAPGTATSAARWQAMKVDSAGNITYADGNPNFDNVATDLTSLTYS